MNTLKVAVVGYGNIGRYAVEAVQAAPDMDLAGVIRRQAGPKIEQPRELADVPVVQSANELTQVDVALLCTPTRSIPDTASDLLQQGIRTVDSYDIHGDLADLRLDLDKLAKAHSTAAIISAGWDPGTDSVVRALLEVMAPAGITYTNFGPGMSMGHSVAVKAMEGVVDALSLTIPVGTGIHRRMVYVELAPGADAAAVENTIKSDPYFVNDETHVQVVPDVKALIDMGHGVTMERRGVSGATHNQRFLWDMRINNPALTAQIMCAAGRAVAKQEPGAYTMLQVAPIDFMPGDVDDIIRRMV